MKNKQLTLPISVISPTDIARLLREVEDLDEFFRQSEIRQGGTPQTPPRYSRLLDEVVVANDMNLLDSDSRKSLLQNFQHLQTNAPVMHISFSVDPPGTYVQKIVGWLRQNIDGLVLVRVGLMPNIGAGCVVRTTNKSFDFSLRKYFDSKHDFFMDRLHKIIGSEENISLATKTEDPVEQQNVVDEEDSMGTGTQTAQPDTTSDISHNSDAENAETKPEIQGAGS